MLPKANNYLVDVVNSLLQCLQLHRWHFSVNILYEISALTVDINIVSSIVLLSKSHRMDIKQTCSLIIFCLILIGAIAIGLYIYFNGEAKVETDFEQKTIITSIEYSTENSKNMILDENFNGILRQTVEDGIKIGNLSYHKHIANLQHKEAIGSLESTTYTYQLVIGSSISVVILICITILIVRVIKLRMARTQSNLPTRNQPNVSAIPQNRRHQNEDFYSVPLEPMFYDIKH